MNIQRMVEKSRKEFDHKWLTPHPRDTLLFLFTEVAEIAEWVLRRMPMKGGYFRTHEKDVSIEMEIGDAAVMLCTLASQLGVDVDNAVEASLAKIARRIGPNGPEEDRHV